MMKAVLKSVLKVGLPLLATCLLPGCAVVVGNTTASSGSSSCKHANPQGEQAIGYCQSVRVGDTVYISGTVGQGDMATAIDDAYRRLEDTLRSHGLGFRHVVKETVYATDLDKFIAHKEVRRKYYGANLPAATWVGVSRLYSPQMVVEIELVAVATR
jgi:enamine deaminase RidA (YjgF/YER057c/UK114 family)